MSSFCSMWRNTWEQGSHLEQNAAFTLTFKDIAQAFAMKEVYDSRRYHSTLTQKILTPLI